MRQHLTDSRLALGLQVILIIGLAGALWEVFEFGMDQLVGTTMQKPMLGDPSGLTDTMGDLIVDALGALTIAVLGYGYLTTDKRSSFLRRWINAFIEKNPRLFQRQG